MGAAEFDAGMKIAELIVVGVFTVLWWLLRQAHAAAKQELERIEKAFNEALAQRDAIIKDLYEKHKDDAAQLVALQREVDREHYRKAELDHKFMELSSALTKGLDKVFEMLQDMNNKLTEHIREKH